MSFTHCQIKKVKFIPSFNLFGLVYPLPNKKSKIYLEFLGGPQISSSFVVISKKKKVSVPRSHQILQFLRWSPNKKRSLGRKPRFSVSFRQIREDFRGCPLFGLRKCGAKAIQCNAITFLILIIEVCFSL